MVSALSAVRIALFYPGQCLWKIHTAFEGLEPGARCLKPHLSSCLCDRFSWRGHQVALSERRLLVLLSSACGVEAPGARGPGARPCAAVCGSWV